MNALNIALTIASLIASVWLIRKVYAVHPALAVLWVALSVGIAFAGLRYVGMIGTGLAIAMVQGAIVWRNRQTLGRPWVIATALGAAKLLAQYAAQ